MTEFSFFCAGEPQPKGSTRAFVVNGHAVTTSTNKNLKTWELRVATEAQRALLNFDIPVFEHMAYTVEMIFFMPKPKALQKKTAFVTKRPDLDKLVRAVLDGLTGVLLEDDAMVFHIKAGKFYTSNEHRMPGVDVSVKFHDNKPIPSTGGDR